MAAFEMDDWQSITRGANLTDTNDQFHVCQLRPDLVTLAIGLNVYMVSQNCLVYSGPIEQGCAPI